MAVFKHFHISYPGLAISQDCGENKIYIGQKTDMLVWLSIKCKKQDHVAPVCLRAVQETESGFNP